MGLQEEIDKMIRQIITDDYPMSIGEWMSLYKEKELDIHPEFQRYYRWSHGQKTRLIESILLGIPIPPIFVSQLDDGTWDVIDGQQRLSAIFEFAGILRNEEGNLQPPLVLEKTSYLPSLKNKVWDDEAVGRIVGQPELPQIAEEPAITPIDTAQQLYIKRSKISVSIVLRQSSELTKYDLFQRLNTGGSSLSYQEVRNVMLIMINRDMFYWMKGLQEDPNFNNCVTATLTERLIKEQYDLELVLRFLVLRNIDEQGLGTIGSDINEFLTDEMKRIALSDDYDFGAEETAFRQTFEILARITSENSFRRYDAEGDRHLGGFRIPAYETIASGIGFNYQNLYEDSSKVEQIIKSIWQDEEFLHYTKGGMVASYRIPKLIPLGRKYFAQQ